MGQELSCRPREEHGLFTAVQGGDVEMLEAILQRDPSLIRRTTVYDRHSALHIAAASGHIEVGVLAALKIFNLWLKFCFIIVFELMGLY